ncbi:MAG TPA: ABC transporter permease subunit/CPBP intramembrane protease [Planctomycetaceae bacterium]|nr:ABC transporter permease subunit/CPBP intramembrane protease [Planctomycetaceae bacterium]
MQPVTTPNPPAAPPDDPPRAAGRRGGRLARLALKELRETLRDRRTIGTLLLMPIFVYALLSVAFQKFLVTQLRPPTGTEYRIAVESEDAQRILESLLSLGHQLVAQQAQPQPATPGEAAPATDRQVARDDDVDFMLVEDAARAVAEFQADLGMRLRRHGTGHLRGGVPLESDWELLVVESSPLSRAAYAFVDRRVQATNIDLLRDRLVRSGHDPAVPVQTARQPIIAEGGAAPFSLATLVPLILILMTMTGAVYPAIDLTAGERERGTLEALIAAPVPRMGLLLAKYVAVLAVALLTAGVNLAAMAATIFATGLDGLLFGEDGLSLAVVASILGLLVLLAAFFSAVLLALTSFARSFKEAQAYLIPLMLVSLAPGILSLLPGLELNGLLAVTPLANIVLLARDLFDRTADPALAVLVVGSTAAYALGAIAAAARVFGTDAILYGSEGSWSDMFRRPAAPRPAPTLTTAFLCLAMLFPLSVLTAAALARQEDLPVPVRLAVSSVATAALFGLLPLAIAALRRIDPGSGFALRRAPFLSWIGATLLGMSLWPAAYEATLAAGWLARAAGLDLIDARLVDLARALAADLRTLSPVLVVLSLAVVPAVFEELFFRGFLYGALRERFRPAATIAASAALFGLFHVVVRDMLAVERLIPSLLLGFVLGWVRHRTGSVLPGTLLHGCHNALLLLLVYYQRELQAIEWLNRSGWMTAEAGTGHLPVPILAAGTAVATAGFVLVALARRQPPRRGSVLPRRR